MLPESELFPEESWRQLALCAQTEPNLWFPEQGAPARAAKAICRRCPVQAPCLEYALNDPSLEGVWGGFSQRERQMLRRGS